MKQPATANQPLLMTAKKSLTPDESKRGLENIFRLLEPVTGAVSDSLKNIIATINENKWSYGYHLRKPYMIFCKMNDGNKIKKHLDSLNRDHKELFKGSDFYWDEKLGFIAFKYDEIYYKLFQYLIKPAKHDNELGCMYYENKATRELFFTNNLLQKFPEGFTPVEDSKRSKNDIKNYWFEPRGNYKEILNPIVFFQG